MSVDGTRHDDGDTAAASAVPRMSVARVYDYLLGGTNNSAADRFAAEQIKALFPELEDWAWCNRGFHQRAARWLAADAGVTQFLDIGSGLPTQNNTHDVVQAVDPACRVVYVDNDEQVAEQAHRLLSDTGRVSFVHGDLRKPDGILANPDVRAQLDFAQPIGLLMTAVIHFVADELDPWKLVGRYLDALVPGSYLVLSQGTYDKQAPATVERATAIYQNANEQVYPRSKPDVERFFAGLQIVPPYDGAKPDVTFGGLWGAEDPEVADDDASRALYAAVGRKP
ncbi:SAM-dependent methyltransferase [Actinopolymorpha sp. B17G11]|uniref:SAM-dependent methyltransferase n=1 Tax=Actinopolymorpha sp. B17G11 TaxID=3160861 RepID=UPI0032E38F0C